MRTPDKLFVIAVLISVTAQAARVDRCRAYVQDVRRATARHLGLDYPWHYQLGQLRQESNCRADVVAPDGGLGLAQFMPATAAAMAKQIGEPLDPLVAADAVQLQAFFIAKLQRQNPAPGRPLWVAFQLYNGGAAALKGEASRAGSWDRSAMRAACRRKTIQLGTSLVDLCNVNYNYPQQIDRYATAYRLGPDVAPWRMW